MPINSIDHSEPQVGEKGNLVVDLCGGVCETLFIGMELYVPEYPELEDE